MPFQPGQSGNPSGGRPGSRHRQQLNGEFIAALLRDFRQGGPKAIERVRRTQPAAYLKILALLVPREHKVEHRNLLKEMTDEELEAAIEALQAMMATQAESAKVIEGRPMTVHCRSRRNVSNPRTSAAIDCLSMWTRRSVRVRAASERLSSLSKSP